MLLKILTLSITKLLFVVESQDFYSNRIAMYMKLLISWHIRVHLAKYDMTVGLAILRPWPIRYI